MDAALGHSRPDPARPTRGHREQGFLSGVWFLTNCKNIDIIDFIEEGQNGGITHEGTGGEAGLEDGGFLYSNMQAGACSPAGAAH